MEPLPLSRESYEGTYKLIGGQVSLDFVNTISWPGTVKEHDWLTPIGNFLVWALHAGVIDKPQFDDLQAYPNDKFQGEMKQILEIRATLAHVLRPFASGKDPSPGAVHHFNELVHKASFSRYIHPSTLKWSWADPGTIINIASPIIWNAALVVTEIDRARVNSCPGCQWIFHDTSRNRRRRWCDMEDCGSRDKALRYYHRKKS